MEETLKKLTDQIYNEGINKANKEAEEIINAATDKAKNIISEAQNKSKTIIEKANKEVEELKQRINTELESTAKQSITSIKQNIVNILINNVIDKPLKEAFNDKDFIKNMILTMFKNWDLKNEQVDFSVLYPENSKLDEFLKTELKSTLNNKITFKPSKSITNGFVIESNKSSYKISFTDEDFSTFIKEYIRPKTFKLLFKNK